MMLSVRRLKPVIIAITLLLAAVPMAPVTAHAEGGLSSLLNALKPSALFKRHKGVEPVTNELYQEECGSCHFPFQPGLLPRRSWERLMAPKALEDHFGDNAELDARTRGSILDFLSRHAADDVWYKRSIKIRRSIPADEAPLRISEVPYIVRAHHEIEKESVKSNKAVRSMSNCERCHRKAESGIFDDDTVQIPE
ncbi:MAG: cytochrome C [Leptospirillia bacterium]